VLVMFSIPIQVDGQQVKGDEDVKLWDWPMQKKDEMVRLVNTDTKFEVALDAQFFTPNEIEVKVCGDELMIFCSHNERTDSYGRISRQISRAYKLPPGVDKSSIRSELNNRGMLIIKADKK